MSHHQIQRQLDAIRAIGEVLSHETGLDGLFTQVVDHISKLVNAERSTLFLYDEDNGEIWSRVAQGQQQQEIRLKVGEGIAGSVAAHKQSIRVEDAYQDERFDSTTDQRTGFHTTSIAAVPILDPDAKLYGVLQVLNHRGDDNEQKAFDDGDVGLLQAIAAQLAYAVKTAQQAETLLNRNAALHRAHAELDFLYQLEQLTSAASTLDELLNAAIARICEQLSSAAGSILLQHEDTGRLYFRAVVGDKSAPLKQVTLEPGQGVVGWVATHGKAAVVNSPEADPRHHIALAQQVGFAAEALVCVPLNYAGQTFGAIEVLNPQSHTYDDEDLKVLTVAAGQIARAITVFRNKQEQQETQRLADLGRMLAGVAHDLRNPMTVISGYTQIMANEEDATERQRRSERVLYQIDEMTAMISDLLAFARGDTRLNPESIALKSIADLVRETWAMYCTPRGIDLRVNTSAQGQKKASGPKVWIDFGRTKRIINNLAKNAVEVLDAKGILTIDLSKMNEGLQINISDNGPGLPEDIRHQMFKPFAISDKQHGTGLGLSIVKRFIDDHGGHINIESKAGQGTSFKVFLPKRLP